MALNKKKLFSIGLLVVVFIFVIGTSESFCSDHFNFTSGDIQNFYSIMRDNSLWYSTENDTSYHNTVVSRWASCDEIINNLSDNDWSTIETMLNDFLEQYWITSGEYYNIYGYNEYGMNDSMVWVLVSPAPRTTDNAQINILFIPYVTGEIVGLENRSTISGDYAYSTQINAYNYNMDGTALSTSTTNALVSLQIRSDGTYGMYTNRINMGTAYNINVARSLGSIHFWYRRDLPNPYYEQNNIVYFIGLLKTCRNNQYSQLDGAKMWQYKGYNFYNYKNVYNGFTYNLNNKLVTSGDNIPPTPTPTPSSSPSGGTVDLTETNSLISDINENLTTVPDISSYNITSGEITSSLGFNISGDPYDNFWTFLTNGLSSALTNTNRTINYSLFGVNHTINLDDTIPHYPEGIQAILNIICIYGITFFIVKQIREMSITIQSGNMDTLLEMNEESGIVDIF